MLETLTVRDDFLSYQGTGLLAGTPQHFVRLAGCNVACPLRPNCDQPEALSPDGNETTIAQILRRIETHWIHITGGEPAEHANLVKLCDAAHAAGHSVQVQTSGSIPLDWNHRPFVSVSPKQPQIRDVSPSEIILVAAQWMTAATALTATAGWDCPVFVIPEATAGKFQTDRMFELLETLTSAGRDARAGLQSHLIWGIR